jgi:HK97 family phage prohead protease
MSEERRIWRNVEELRIVEDDGQVKIEGLAVPYNALSEDLGGFRERIVPGAFGETIRSADGGDDLYADIEHDRRQLLARASKGTLSFREEPRGLLATITLPNTTRGKDVAEDVRAGNLDGMSIAWAAKGTEDRFLAEDGETVREVLKADLRGVTLTSSPAYRQTVDSLVMRSLEEFQTEQTEDWRAENDKMRRRIALERMVD